MNLEELQLLASTIESAVTALGIILGGYWAYSRFVWHREKKPKAQISQKISQRSLGNETILIHVQVTIKNIGKVLIPLRLAKALLFKVLPLETSLMKKIKDGEEIFNKERTSVPWPQIAKRVWEWEKGKAEIEPGEAQVLYCEFLVPIEIETVQITNYLEDSAIGGVGWTGKILVDVTKQPQTKED